MPSSAWKKNLLSTPTLTPERFRRHLFDLPTMQPQHAMTAAGKGIIRRYQEIFCHTRFQPLSFESCSESASRGSNPRGSQYHLAEVLREKSQCTRCGLRSGPG